MSKERTLYDKLKGPGPVVGNALSGAAEAYEQFGDNAARTGRVTKVLRVAGPAMEVAGAAWGVYQAATHEQQTGQQAQADPQGWGAAASVASGLGGIAMGVGAAAGVAPAVVIGLAVVAVAEGTLWAISLVNRIERQQADLLWAWLPEGSVWGKRYGAVSRDALFRLLRKGGDREPPPLKEDLLAEETEGFAERAYTFPTDARAQRARGGAAQPTGPAVLTRERRQVIASPSAEVPGLAGVLSASTETQIECGGERYHYRGPRFVVSGTVYFDPAQPLDPEPAIPRTDESGNPILPAEDGEGAGEESPLMSQGQVIEHAFPRAALDVEFGQ